MNFILNSTRMMLWPFVVAVPDHQPARYQMGLSLSPCCRYLDHQHDLGRLWIDLDPHDIEATGFRGLDRAGYVLLAEIARRSGHYSNRLRADAASSSPIGAAFPRSCYGEARVTTPSHGVALINFAKS
jgi:hypothetical protein